MIPTVGRITTALRARAARFAGRIARRFGITRQRDAIGICWALAIIQLLDHGVTLLSLGRAEPRWYSRALSGVKDDMPVGLVWRAIWRTRARPVWNGCNRGRHLVMALAAVPELLLQILSAGRLTAGWSWSWELDGLADWIDRVDRAWIHSRVRQACFAPRRWRHQLRAWRIERRAPTMRTYWPRVPASVRDAMQVLLVGPEGEPRFEYADNWRAGRADDPAWMAAYDRQQARGCCGSYDTEVVLDGVTWRIGWNYGH